VIEEASRRKRNKEKKDHKIHTLCTMITGKFKYGRSQKSGKLHLLNIKTGWIKVVSLL